VAYIIDTTGGRLPEEVSSWMQNLSSLHGSVADAGVETQVSWTFQHFNFEVVLRLSGARIPDDRLLATDNTFQWSIGETNEHWKTSVSG
jgi:hypothetical protein